MARLTEDRVAALFEAVCAVVCQDFGISREDLISARGNGVVLARQTAMYLLKLQDVTLARVGRLFGGRTQSTVHHALAAIEDARDDDDFDARLDQLEILVLRKAGGAA